MKALKSFGLENLIKLLKWKPYYGMPDIIVFNNDEFFFVEVKSEKDNIKSSQFLTYISLSEDLGFHVELFLVNKNSTKVNSICKNFYSKKAESTYQSTF